MGHAINHFEIESSCTNEYNIKRDDTREQQIFDTQSSATRTKNGKDVSILPYVMYVFDSDVTILLNTFKMTCQPVFNSWCLKMLKNHACELKVMQENLIQNLFIHC